jgi:hypothetical protein
MSEVPSDFPSKFQTFLDVCVKEAPEARGATFAVAEETSEADGQKVHIFTALIGWTSVEKHMAFRETDTFKDNVGPVRSDKVVKRGMVHIAFQ